MDSDKLLKRILDGTNQLIQYSTRADFKMRYANEAAKQFTNHADVDCEGQYCYKYMMGMDAICPFCPMLQMPEGQNSFETEIDNGNQVFAVKTEVLTVDGEELFIEYASDITTVRRAQQLHDAQTQMIFNSIPEAQGIFYMNLTKNTVLRVEGVATAISHLRNEETADQLLHGIASYIPEKAYRDRFAEVVNRISLLNALEEGKDNFSIEVPSYFSDGSVRWARISVRLMRNPVSGDAECIAYGIDVDTEIRYREQASENENKYNRMRETAKRDLLTGLYGKIAFEGELTRYLNEKQDLNCAVVFLDLDNFKNVNDTFGHIMGDEVIVDTADRLQSIYKNKDILARFGGDEFCILVKDISREKLAQRLEETKKALYRTYDGEEGVVTVSTSIGAVYYTKDSSFIPRDLLELSDQALLEAKRTGKNKFVVYQ